MPLGPEQSRKARRLALGDEAIVILSACDAMACLAGADSSGNNRETATWTNAAAIDQVVYIGLEEYDGPDALHYLFEWDLIPCGECPQGPLVAPSNQNAKASR